MMISYKWYGFGVERSNVTFRVRITVRVKLSIATS